MTSFKWGIISAVSALVISLLIGIMSGVGASHVIIRAIIFAAVFFGLGFAVCFVINSYFPDLLLAGSADEYAQSDEQPGTRVSITMDNTGEYAVPELFKTPDDPREMGNIDDLLSGAFRARSPDGYSAFGGLDADREDGYNERDARSDPSYRSPGVSAKVSSEEIPYLEDDTQESSEGSAQAGSAVFTPSFGDDVGMGGLPDLDMMAKAFSSFGSGQSAPSAASAARSASQQGASSFEAAPQDLAFTQSAEIEEAPAPSAPRSNKGNKPEPIKGDFSPKELAEGIRSVLSKDK